MGAFPQRGGGPKVWVDRVDAPGLVDGHQRDLLDHAVIPTVQVDVETEQVEGEGAEHQHCLRVGFLQDEHGAREEDADEEARDDAMGDERPELAARLVRALIDVEHLVAPHHP